MSRWAQFLIILFVGLTLGVVYGWIISPVEYVDTSPDTLREDYRTDFVLMVAEVYQSERDIESAVQRLAILGESHPQEILLEAIEYGVNVGYSTMDLLILRELHDVLINWQPLQDASTSE
jgi:hypothetical protein